MNRTIIGITPDINEGSESGYSAYKHYALRENYVKSVQAAGGIPMILPYACDFIRNYVKILDGIVITGGNFDIDPKYYGQNIMSERVVVNDERTAFEYEILQEMFAAGKPILGICGGEQLINIAFGGSLIQHIPDSIVNCLEHEQKIAKHLPSHMVRLKENTLIKKIVGSDGYMVNSTHHQAVDSVGHGLVVSAVADDSVIEAIEHSHHHFCLGVQWHPEFSESNEDQKIFKAFVKACDTKN